jgi:hypothetical protein
VRGLKRAVAFVITLTVMLLLGLVTAGTASAAPKTGSVTSNITSMLPAGYTGQVAVTHFTNRGGTLIATGTATVTRIAAQTTATQPFAVPVTRAQTSPVTQAQAAATCQILNLVLGPLHLNLLGPVVDLNQVVLNITAVSGAGNLLGNLLCAIAGLLDGPSPLGAIAGLLNRILAILG